jgi:hypothetical protein
VSGWARVLVLVIAASTGVAPVVLEGCLIACSPASNAAGFPGVGQGAHRGCHDAPDTDTVAHGQWQATPAGCGHDHLSDGAFVVAAPGSGRLLTSPFVALQPDSAVSTPARVVRRFLYPPRASPAGRHAQSSRLLLRV